MSNSNEKATDDESENKLYSDLYRPNNPCCISTCTYQITNASSELIDTASCRDSISFKLSFYHLLIIVLETAKISKN